MSVRFRPRALMKLSNKIAIVTGATSGIGLAIARRFAQEGARVVVASRGADTTDVPNTLYIKTDVRNEHDVQNLIQQTVTQLGRIDIVVNNAGVSKAETMAETTTPDYELIMDTNVKGVFLMTKYALPHLLKTRGTIINIASKLALIPDPEVPVYSASKAAVVMLTKANALAYARDGVRINAICPGPIDTPLLQGYFRDRKEMADYYAEHNPMGRIGTPDDVANVAVFLASDEANYVTGATYTVDGGGSLDN